MRRWQKKWRSRRKKNSKRSQISKRTNSGLLESWIYNFNSLFSKKREEERPSKFSKTAAEKRKEIGEKAKERKRAAKAKKESEKQQKVSIEPFYRWLSGQGGFAQRNSHFWVQDRKSRYTLQFLFYQITSDSPISSLILYLFFEKGKLLKTSYRW